MKKTIFVVEDEAAIRDLYTLAIENTGNAVECFERGEEMFDVLKGVIPDLILLDIMLDGEDGFDILRELKSNPKSAQIPVVMVSAKGEELSKVKGLNMGADDYIEKPFGVFELIARINAALRKSVIGERHAFKDIIIDDATHTLCINGSEAKCTLKIYELVKLFVINAEKVVSREELLRTVWGEEFSGETRTLDMHVAETRKIMKAAGSAASIITVRSVGYILK